MPEQTQIFLGAVADAPDDYTLADNVEFVLRAVRAEFTDNGASGSWLPTVELISDSDHVIAQALDTNVVVAAGGSADVSFFPRGRRVAAGSGLTLDYNLGEIGHSITTALGTTGTAPVSFQDVQAGDGILVLAMAPVLPSGAAIEGTPQTVTDTKGNTYGPLWFSQFQAFPANVNEGVTVQLFYCTAASAGLVAGVDSVTATWDHPVFDRVVSIWAVRHVGGANFPTVLDATPDNDAAVFASASVTLTSPAFTPSRDKAMEFALIITAKSGGVGAFGNVPGYTGFFQAEFRAYTGSKQSYLVNPQTSGANAYLIAGSIPAPYEDDLGVLPGGVFVPSFNGVGQIYTAGTNAWKGIILIELD